MNIIVFVKQVPDTATRIKIGAGGKNIDEADITWIISPYDDFALEEALKIKESKGAGKVTVVSMGPERVSTSLRNALAMGADEAVHVNWIRHLKEVMHLPRLKFLLRLQKHARSTFYSLEKRGRNGSISGSFNGRRNIESSSGDSDCQT